MQSVFWIFKTLVTFQISVLTKTVLVGGRYLHNCWLLWVQPSGIHHVWNIRCEGWCLQLWSCHVRAHYWAQASGQGTRAFCLKRGSSFLRICCICTRFIWCLLVSAWDAHSLPGHLSSSHARNLFWCAWTLPYQPSFRTELGWFWYLQLKTKEGAKPGALGNTPAAWHWCARKNGRSSIRGCIPGKVSLPACRRCCLVCTGPTLSII